MIKTFRVCYFGQHISIDKYWSMKLYIYSTSSTDSGYDHNGNLNQVLLGELSSLTPLLG